MLFVNTRFILWFWAGVRGVGKLEKPKVASYVVVNRCLLYAFHKTLLNKPINKNVNKVRGRLAICGSALLTIGSAGQVDALRCDVRSSPDVLFLCVRAAQLPLLQSIYSVRFLEPSNYNGTSFPNQLTSCKMTFFFYQEVVTTSRTDRKRVRCWGKGVSLKTDWAPMCCGIA
jgi:hypothetical protein